MESFPDWLLRCSSSGGASRSLRYPVENRMVAASSGGVPSLISGEPSKRQNLRSATANFCRHLGHCFMAITYLHCNLPSKREKSVAGGVEIFMKFYEKRSGLSLRTPLIPKRLYSPSEELSGLGGACCQGYWWLPIIQEVTA